MARWSSDLDIQGHYLRGCREFKRLACIVTLRKFLRAFQSREPPGQHRPRASLRRPVKPGDGDPQEDGRAVASAVGGVIGGYWALATLQAGW